MVYRWSRHQHSTTRHLGSTMPLSPTNRRPRMESAPPEIKSMISSFLAPETIRDQSDLQDLLALSRLSKQFYLAARRHLYRSVALTVSIPRQVLFLRTLVENPWLRPDVHRLSVESDGENCFIYNPQASSLPPKFCLVRSPHCGSPPHFRLKPSPRSKRSSLLCERKARSQFHF